MLAGVASIEQRTPALAARLRDRLAPIPGVRVLDRGPRLAALVTFGVAGRQPQPFKAAMDARGINSALSFREFAQFDFGDKGVEWIMLGANLVRTILLALVPVLYWTDALSMVSLLVIACAVGVASVLFDVSWMSYVPTLVRDPSTMSRPAPRWGWAHRRPMWRGPGSRESWSAP